METLIIKVQDLQKELTLNKNIGAKIIEEASDFFIVIFASGRHYKVIQE